MQIGLCDGLCVGLCVGLCDGGDGDFLVVDDGGRFVPDGLGREGRPLRWLSCAADGVIVRTRAMAATAKRLKSFMMMLCGAGWFVSLAFYVFLCFLGLPGEACCFSPLPYCNVGVENSPLVACVQGIRHSESHFQREVDIPNRRGWGITKASHDSRISTFPLPIPQPPSTTTRRGSSRSTSVLAASKPRPLPLPRPMHNQVSL